MIHENHTWVSLHHLAFEVVKRVRGTKLKSVYTIVEICEMKDCRAGRTANNEVFIDVGPGIELLEGAEIYTGKLEKR